MCRSLFLQLPHVHSTAGLVRSKDFPDAGTMRATALGTEGSNGAITNDPRASDYKAAKIDISDGKSIFEQTQFKLKVGADRES